MKSTLSVLLSVIIFSSCVKLGTPGGPGAAGYIDYADSVNIVTTVAGGIQGFANGYDTVAKFNTPYGLAIDTACKIYVADELNNCIRVIDTLAKLVNSFAGTSVQGLFDTVSLSAQFNYPTALAFDRSGNLFVADQGNNVIREITAAGSVITFAGTGQPGFVNGNDTTAQFYFPQGIALDTLGNVYVADEGNNRIRKITPAGVVSTFAGSGVHGLADGNDTLAMFTKPEGLALDAMGNLYVADAGNNCIRKITPAGVVTTLAGSGVFGYADGTGSGAQFAGPAALAVDAAGNIYVADEYNCRIRKITSAGVVTSVAGTYLQGYLDGNGALAEFNYPTGIALDKAGNIYVADANNNVIRKITLH